MASDTQYNPGVLNDPNTDPSTLKYDPVSGRLLRPGEPGYNEAPFRYDPATGQYYDPVARQQTKEKYQDPELGSKMTRSGVTYVKVQNKTTGEISWVPEQYLDGSQRTYAGPGQSAPDANNYSTGGDGGGSGGDGGGSRLDDIGDQLTPGPGGTGTGGTGGSGSGGSGGSGGSDSPLLNSVADQLGQPRITPPPAGPAGPSHLDSAADQLGQPRISPPPAVPGRPGLLENVENQLGPSAPKPGQGDDDGPGGTPGGYGGDPFFRANYHPLAERLAHDAERERFKRHRGQIGNTFEGDFVPYAGSPASSMGVSGLAPGVPMAPSGPNPAQTGVVSPDSQVGGQLAGRGGTPTQAVGGGAATGGTTSGGGDTGGGSSGGWTWGDGSILRALFGWRQ